MRLPECSTLQALLDQQPPLVRAQATTPEVGEHFNGRITEVGPTLLRASLPGVGLGERCRLAPSNIEAEVVAIDGEYALLSPFSPPLGVTAGSNVQALGKPLEIALGDFLFGSVIDGLGRPLDGRPPPVDCLWRGVEHNAPNALTRPLIDTPLPLGVRAIDALLTCGVGQRIGIFAAAGGGKSTLLSMVCDGNLADVIVLTLIGERGREVREFLERSLSPAARERTIVVVSTSDRPALERLKAAYTATTIAEHFRDQGKTVLLMMDSLTRFARAAREIGLASGESCGASGYPPSFFARLPCLLERAGPAAVGSITGIYTILVEGDNMNEPVADEVRSILDGHIVLSRKLAEANHYPAIDIGASISRVMSQIVDAEHRQMAAKVRRLMSAYNDIELLVRVGEYQTGQDAEADEALTRRAAIQGLLCQSTTQKNTLQETVQHLCQALTD